MACLNPITIRVPPDFRVQQVSCRKCHNCRIQKQSEIEFGALMSLLQGYKYGTGASFVTLTYNNDFLPLVEHNGEVYGSLRKSHFYNWWSKVRKVFRDKGQYVPQFLCAGEYGDLGRPHYHVLVLGSNCNEFSSISKNCWKKKDEYFGLIDCKPLRAGGIRYVADYIFKENDKTFEKYDNLGLERPFLRHSIRFGLDYFWNDFEYDPADFTYLHNGKRRLIPTFYRKKLPGGEFFDYENCQSIVAAYEEGIPFEIYNLRSAFNNAELDIFRKRQKHTPVDSLSSGLRNYLTSSLEVYHARTNYACYIKTEFAKAGLPTNKDFYTQDKIDSLSPEIKHDFIWLLKYLD